MIIRYLESLLRLLSWKKFVNILTQQLLLIITLTNSFLLYPHILWVDTQRKLAVRHINDQPLLIGLSLYAWWISWHMFWHNKMTEKKEGQFAVRYTNSVRYYSFLTTHGFSDRQNSSFFIVMLES
jgi:hypothetical protein